MTASFELGGQQVVALNGNNGHGFFSWRRRCSCSARTPARRSPYRCNSRRAVNGSRADVSRIALEFPGRSQRVVSQRRRPRR
jgi:hypothetical protein